MTGIFTRLLDALSRPLPSACWVCRSWASEAICGDCLARFARPRLRCTTCAIPLTASSADLRCGACLSLGSALDSCHAAVDYADPWDRLLQRFKYSDAGELSAQPALAGSLALITQHVAAQDAALAAALQQIGKSDWVIPVALHPQRQRERGFNQAQRFAQAMLPPTARIRTDLLLRVKNTAVQADLPRDQRMANLRQAFIAAPLSAHELRGAHVTLIDDVTTTTATLSAAANALRQAGATHVHALVFARTA
ncbi:MAG: ComF family protein [Brachymonas sp.]